MRRLVLVSGFSRGGTNVVWNLICSHPAILSTGVELNEIMGRATSIPMRSKIWVELFAISRFSAPKNAVAFLCDRIISTAERYAREGWGRWKSLETLYSDTEVRSLPICTKSVSSWSPGPLFSLLQRNCPLKYNPLLLKGFGGVKTIYVLRDGEALCNGWMRRGCTPENAGYWYARIVRKMIADYKHRPDDVCFVHFKDVLKDPMEVGQRLRSFVELPLVKLANYHLKAKPVLRENGARETQRGAAQEMIWIPASELTEFIVPGVDDIQSAMLSSTQREDFVRASGDVGSALAEVAR